MKIIAIGDTHGRTKWKQIIDSIYINDIDKIIFIGDYFDSREGISFEQQKENFEQIIRFKTLYPDKVILLIGNHDFHYMKRVNETYSSFQALNRDNIRDLIESALSDNLMQMCFIDEANKLLFSHAGVTITWLENQYIYYNDYDPSIGLETYINNAFYSDPMRFKFTYGYNLSSGGDDVTQSPIWVRKNSLVKDKIPDYIQIVGHSMQDSILIDEENKLMMIDVLATCNEYLYINDNNIEVKIF